MYFEFNKENLKFLSENSEENKRIKADKLTQEYAVKLRSILVKTMIESAENGEFEINIVKEEVMNYLDLKELSNIGFENILDKLKPFFIECGFRFVKFLNWDCESYGYKISWRE